MSWATPDLAEFLALAALDPVVNVFVDYRARTTRLDRRWLGGEVWGRFVEGTLVSACHVGANLVPVQAGPDDVAAFAERARGPRRGVASIVGPQVAVEALWAGLADDWGTPREVRSAQPHLVLDGPPAVTPDPARATDHDGGVRRGLSVLRRLLHRGARRLAGVRRRRHASTGPGCSS